MAAHNHVHVANGLLTFEFVNGLCNLNVPLTVVKQTLTLEAIKISDHTIDTSTDPMIYIQTSFLNSGLLIDKSGKGLLPIILEGSVETQWKPKLAIDMVNDLSGPTELSIRKADGSPVGADVPSLILQLSFSYLD